MGDAILVWTGADWNLFYYFGTAYPTIWPSGWADSSGNPVPEPVISVGEGFLIQNASGSNEYWTGSYPFWY